MLRTGFSPDIVNKTLTYGGTVVAWGDNPVGSLVPEGLMLTGVVSIAAGYAHVVALKKDGTVVVWGENIRGQGIIPTGLVAAAIEAGDHHTVALKEDGTVVAWGDNRYGQTAFLRA